jgi:uncharacterized membrane protein
MPGERLCARAAYELARPARRRRFAWSTAHLDEIASFADPVSQPTAASCVFAVRCPGNAFTEFGGIDRWPARARPQNARGDRQQTKAQRSREVSVKSIEESIELDVPVSKAYNQWTQFESFPRFMEGVERVEQRDDKHLHWVAEVGGEKQEWDAEITEQHPEHRVAWKALDQDGPNGVVTFHKLDEGRTKLMVQMDYEPEGLKESVGSAVGIDSRRVKGDLESFKEFIEGRAHETGAWRGNIEN